MRVLSFLLSSPSSFFYRRLTNSLEPDCFLMRLLWTDTLLSSFSSETVLRSEACFFRLGTPLREESRDQGDGTGGFQLLSKFFPQSITNGSSRRTLLCVFDIHSQLPQFAFLTERAGFLCESRLTTLAFSGTSSTVLKHAIKCAEAIYAVNERQTHHAHCLRPRTGLLKGKGTLSGAANDGGGERAMSVLSKGGRKGGEGAARRPSASIGTDGALTSGGRFARSLSRSRKEGGSRWGVRRVS